MKKERRFTVYRVLHSGRHVDHGRFRTYREALGRAEALARKYPTWRIVIVERASDDDVVHTGGPTVTGELDSSPITPSNPTLATQQGPGQGAPDLLSRRFGSPGSGVARRAPFSFIIDEIETWD